MIHTNVQIVNNQTLPDGSVGQCGYLHNKDNMLCEFQNGLLLVKDRSYVLSLWIKSESSKKIAIATGTKVVQSQNVTNEWNRVAIKFISDGTSLSFSLESGTYYVYKIKLEEGDAVTDWTPAPDDLVEKAKIVSEINQSPESISIKAEKISLEGIVTANEKFKILEDGSMEATGGKFTGKIVATEGSFTGAIRSSDTIITGGKVEIKVNDEEYNGIHLYTGNPYTDGSEGYVRTLIRPSGIYLGRYAGHSSSLSITTTDIKFTGAGGNITTPGCISCESILANTINGRTWNWAGQSGQPNWVWGGNDNNYLNMYVWSPSNFSVNYANSSGYANRSAGTDDGRLSGLNKIRCGTLVLGGDRGQGSARVLFYLNEVRSLVGDGNANPYSIAIVANNGDGNTNGAHVEGVTYIPDSHWAVVFDRSVGTGLLRINFAIIYGY